MLEIDQLSKSYGAIRALDDLTFDVRPGEIFGFVGSNGAGKTTAMRIMLGVLAADAGQVRWNGAGLDLQTRRKFGYMPEERGLYPKMKVGEQLRYLAGLHGMTPAQAAEAVDHWTDLLGVGRGARTPSRSSRWATSSACSSRPRSCTTPSCLSWTSRSPASTRWPST